MTDNEFTRDIEGYNKIYDRMYNHVIKKLGKLNSVDLATVKGERLIYKKARPKMDVLVNINKMCIELDHKKQEEI